MGKGKGKKVGKTSISATTGPRIQAELTTIPQNESHQINGPNITRSTDAEVTCAVCNKMKIGSWLVQCDECDQNYHFKCVGFTHAGQDDPWSCAECVQKVLSSTAKDESKQNANHQVQEREKVVISAENIDENTVHKERGQNSDLDAISNLTAAQERGRYKVQCEKLSQEFTQRMDDLMKSYRERRLTQSTELNDPQQPSQIGATVDDAEKLKCSSIDADTSITKVADQEASYRTVYKTVVTNQQVAKTTEKEQVFGRTGTSVSSKASKASSQRLRDIEFQRLQAEYELEQKLDEEKLALERERLTLEKKALELKEKRERKLMEGKFRAMEDITSVHSKSSVGTKSVIESMRSEHSKKTVRSSLVSNWIQDQRKQNYTEKPMNPAGDENYQRLLADTYGVDLSIPIEEKEMRQIQQRRFESGLSGDHVTNEGSENDRQLKDNDQMPVYGRYEHKPLNQRTTNQYNASTNLPPNADVYAYNEGLQNSKPMSRLAMAYAHSQRNIATNQQSSDYRSSGDNARISWNLKEQDPKQSTQVHSENRNHFNSDNRSNMHTIPTGYLPNTQRSRQSDVVNKHQSPVKLTPNQIASRHSMAKDDLPLFSGRPLEWIQFIKSYEDSTELCGFSKNENLSRLRKCLKDKAYDLVESQLYMPECVDQIIAALREKFGKPELIAQATLAKVRGEPTIKPDKLEALADFGYKVRNACNVIESLELHFYLYDPDLVRDIVAKLPYQIKIDWARHAERLQSSYTHVNLRAIADWLHKLARTLNLVTTLEMDSSSNYRKAERKAENKSGFVHYHEKPKLEVTNQVDERCLSCSKGCKYVGECSRFKGLTVDDRWNLVKEKQICRKCLHRHKNSCTNAKYKFCGVSGCELKHNPLLHNEERHAKFIRNKSNSDTPKIGKVAENNTTGKRESSNGTTTIAKPNNVHQVEGDEELFRILPVIVHNKGTSITAYAFFDEGSSYTMMEKDTADQLNASGTKENICLLWTKGIHRQEETLNVNLEISGVDESDVRHQLRSVNVVEDLGLTAQSIDPQRLGKMFKYLKGLPLPKYQNAIPTILIGIRHIRLTTPLETIEGGENEPIASRSRLGWTVCGPINGKVSNGRVNHHIVSRCPCRDRDEDLHKIVKDHFTIENFGVSVKSMDMESEENRKALDMMEKFTVRKGNRFETRLLWKNEAYKLPDSYGMARKRLTCLENKGAAVVQIINGIINDYLTKGYASKLSSAQLEAKHPRTFYLPIFTVTNPKKPGKIRPVFDAAARVNGTSLNSTLLTGPDLLSPLIDILRRFREHRIAVAGDIEEMFYRVLMNEEDRHSQRFLWRNGDKDKEPDVYQFNVMTFGSKCSPTAAQFVKNVNAAEYELEFPIASNSIIKNHYVDDMLDGAKSIKEAIQLINDVKFVHSRAGFNIRNFKSNSKEVLDAIGETTDDNKVDLAEKVERVLGMFWDTKTDCFMFSLQYTKLSQEILQEKTLPTKRELLRLTMSLFDPLGLISYYVIHARILMQNVWKSQIGWDERLTEDLAGNWFRWIRLLQGVEELKIPRWYSTNLGSDLPPKNELHIFVDAGEDAFAAVAFLRTTNDVSTECSLIGSKARVTPLKYLCNTRRELMAAVLGSRLVNSVENGLSLKFERRVIWSDSTTVLTWLHSDHKRYSQFVAHRVGEILESTDLTEWRWVPTKVNVADDATKWDKTPIFDVSSRWFIGPEFLRLPENEWPKQKVVIPNSTTEEMRASCSHSRLIMPSIVDATKFSTWQRLLRAVANTKRIANWMIAKQRKLVLPTLKLSQEDLLEAERRLIRQAQWEGFLEEMTILSRNQISDPKQQKPFDSGSSIKDCTPYLDEFGIMRVKGRIDSATAVTADAKRPIILPKNNHVTRLIVLSYHTRFQHRNHESVVNELKQRFYIPQIRTTVRSVRWNCKLCVLRRCRPKNPQMADLPPIRFEAGIRPFTYTGIDYFGPFKVKVGRQYPKRWGIIYTCLTIRAVWIDVVPSYDTDSCILSIRDFINRKGVVQEFYTDNGSNFKGADNELTKEIDKIDFKRLSDEFTSCYTIWKFNPPETPHMGGMWERLIRTIKTSLYDSMITRTPTDQMLRSWLIEAENIVNSRPLTFVPIESEDDESLTPNHFMLGSSNGLKPPGKFNFDGPHLRRQWKEVQRCTDLFWKRFIREYCPTLIKRTKWFEQVKPLEVGDLVINFDEDAPRNTYKRARVVETIMGTNNQVRRAKVQFPNGSTLWRPAHKLGLLDVNPMLAPTDKRVLDHPMDDKNKGENVGASNLSERSLTGTGVAVSTVSRN